MNVFFAATLAESMPVLPASGWILVTTGYNIAVNWFGIRTSARFNVCTLMFQVALLIGFLILGIHALLSAAMPLFSSSPSWGPTTTPAGVFSAASLCVMACLGVDAITTLSGEVRRPAAPDRACGRSFAPRPRCAYDRGRLGAE